MDYERYIENLEQMDLNEFFKDEDDIPGGLLSEFIQPVPEGFHNQIISSIRKQKRNGVFVNKKYMPMIAAAAITIIFIGGIKIFDYNQSYSSHQVRTNKSIALENVEQSRDRVFREKAEKGNTEAGKNNLNSDEKVAKKGIEMNNTDIERNQFLKKDSKKTTEKENNVRQGNLNTASASEDKINSTANDKNVNSIDKPETNDDSQVVNDDESKDGDLENDGNEDETNSELDPSEDNESKLLGYLDESNEDNNEKPVRQIVPRMMFSAFNYTSIVNYDVALYMNETDIINYVYSRGRVVGPNIYRFTIEDFNILNSMLLSKNIEKTIVNAESDSSEYVNVRIIIN